MAKEISEVSVEYIYGRKRGVWIWTRPKEFFEMFSVRHRGAGKSTQRSSKTKPLLKVSFISLFCVEFIMAKDGFAIIVLGDLTDKIGALYTAGDVFHMMVLSLRIC